MSNKFVKPLTLAVGAAFIGSFALAQDAGAASFSLTDLDSGYMQVGEDADKAKEGKCGEGKCGEGKCGEDKAAAEGKCGEGKCGEGKCGAEAAPAADKAAAEGKCGEGKCGEDKAKEGACGGRA